METEETSPELEFSFVTFSRKRSRNVRRRIDETEDDDTSVSSILEQAKDLQELRKRPHGVNILNLAVGEKAAVQKEATHDQFKLKSGGGMVDMKTLKTTDIKPSEDDAYDTGIGTQFSAETNARDEDAEMMKYINEELAKKRKEMAKASGVESNTEQNATKEKAHVFMLPEVAALHSLPEHLRSSTTKRSEEMLSNQMLSGIPEVDLGIEAKIKNIEATEEAKQNLLNRKAQRDLPSEFVPTNVAVNFMHHNRYNIEDPDSIRRRSQLKEVRSGGKKKIVVVGEADDKSTAAGPGGRKNANERASDDYHFEKFRKQFRR